MGNDYKYNFIAAIVKIYYSLIKMFHSFLDHIDKTITDIYRKKNIQRQCMKLLSTK